MALINIFYNNVLNHNMKYAVPLVFWSFIASFSSLIKFWITTLLFWYILSFYDVVLFLKG